MRRRTSARERFWPRRATASNRPSRAARSGTMAGSAEPLVLDEPLSFWGGVDPATGVIVDSRHPQRGECVAGRVLVMPAARGSSSSASVLAECVRAGVAPTAIVLGRPDPILAIGALVAEELYGVRVPVEVDEQETGTARSRTG